MKTLLLAPGRREAIPHPLVSSRLLALLLAGGLLALGAWFYRQQFNATFHPLPAALLDPNVHELAARAQTLQAQIDRDPRQTEPRWELADIYQRVNLLTAAAEQLQAIIQQQPSNLRAHLALGNMRLALQQYDAASQVFRRATELQPQSGAAWQCLATVLYHREHYVEARDAARRAVRLLPSDANTHYTLGVADVEFAMQYPNPQAHTRELVEGLQHLKLVLAVWPDNPDVYYRLGRAYYGIRDVKSAIKYLKRAHEIEPRRADITLLLCNTYRIAGNLDAARQSVEQALRETPDDPGLNDFSGQLLETSRAPDAPARSIAAFGKALAARPDDPVLHEKLGSVYQRLGKTEAARAEFERAIQLDPNRSFPYQQLANVYTRLNQPQKADFYAKLANAAAANDRQLQNVEAVCKMHPTSVPLHLILADRYRDLGRTTVARGEYEIVLKLDPSNQRARSGLAALKSSTSASAAPTTLPAPTVAPGGRAGGAGS